MNNIKEAIRTFRQHAILSFGYPNAVGESKNVLDKQAEQYKLLMNFIESRIDFDYEEEIIKLKNEIERLHSTYQRRCAEEVRRAITGHKGISE